MGEPQKRTESLSKKWFLLVVLTTAGNEILGRLLELWLSKSVAHSLAVFITFIALTLFRHKESPQNTPVRLLCCVLFAAFVFCIYRW